MTYEELQQLFSDLGDKDAQGLDVEDKLEDYDKILKSYKSLLDQNVELLDADTEQKAKIVELRNKLKTNWLYSTQTEEQIEKSDEIKELEKTRIEDLV